MSVQQHSSRAASSDEPARARISAVPTAAASERSLAIDALRGLVIALMILDHTRDFFFGMQIRPTDLTVTTPVLFFTRWVTHFCAPVFVFLAGASAYLYSTKHSARETARFLVTRGALLVVLELTIVRFCWIPEPFYRMTLLQVIWATGCSMLLLAAVACIRPVFVLTLAAALWLAHTWLQQVGAQGGWLIQLLTQRSSFHPLPNRLVMVTYPILPWCAVMFAGYAFGSWLTLPRTTRTRHTFWLGAALSGSFIALRLLSFGDPQPFVAQATWVGSVMGFLNCEKYPPSLDYLLMTLGPALCLLALWDHRGGTPSRVQRVLAVYGGVPLFCYVVHLAVLRFTALPIAFARFGASAFMPPPGHAGSPELPLWVTYAVWLSAVLCLYPAARWFLRKKRSRPQSMLRYF